MSAPTRPPGSLRLRVLLPPIGLLSLVLLALGLLGVRWVEEQTRAGAELRAQATLRGLGSSPELLATVPRGQAERVDRMLLRALDADPVLAYLALKAPDRVTFALRQDEEGQRIAREQRALERLHEALSGAAKRRAAGQELLIVPQPLPPPARTEPGEAPQPQGTLYAAVSLRRQGEGAREGLVGLLIVGGTGLICYVMLVLYLLGGFTRRVEQLWHGVRRMQQGDLQARIGAVPPDELGEVGRAFDAATERVARVISQLRTIGQSIERAARDAAEGTAAVQRGVGTQMGDTDAALQCARDFVQTLGAAVRQAESIRDEVRLAANIVQRLATVSQEGAASAEEAERVLGATAESIQQIAASISDVAHRASTLGEAAASTASAMLAVKQSIGRVRETAGSAAALAEHAGLDAERGSLILADSLTGIEHIREASHAISAVTDDLQRRVGEIGDVLHLITELTQRTNLLALNASIIAAQAGAEGRGFAVVADEIKDLARRTANSAGSIDSLIQSLAESAHAARRAAIAGGEAVEAGASQARDAARTMGDILTRLRNWAQMAKSIAAVTDDQARGVAQVMRSIQEVQAHVGEIASKMAEQTRRAEYIHRQGARLQEVVAGLAGSALEQREGTAQVSDTLQRLVHVVDEMSSAERNRVGEGEHVRNLLEMMRRVVSGQRDAVGTLERTAEELRAQAHALLTELGRLRT